MGDKNKNILEKTNNNNDKFLLYDVTKSVCQFCGKYKYVKKDVDSGMYLCLTCKRCRQTVL